MVKITKKKANKIISDLLREYEEKGTNCEAYKELEEIGINQNERFHSLIKDINEKYKNNKYCKIKTLSEDLIEMANELDIDFILANKAVEEYEY